MSIKRNEHISAQDVKNLLAEFEYMKKLLLCHTDNHEVLNQFDIVEEKISTMLFRSNMISFSRYQAVLGKSIDNFNGKWIFPEKRSDIYGLQNCVYFVSHPYEKIVKIGFTSRLAERTTRIARDIGTNVNHINTLAVFITEQYREAELALHRHFDNYRIKGEWFQRKPVVEFIKSVQRGIGS